jgi:hypothetical protein
MQLPWPLQSLGQRFEESIHFPAEHFSERKEEFVVQIFPAPFKSTLFC